MSEIPRKNNVELMTRPELIIREAMIAVEEMKRRTREDGMNTLTALTIEESLAARLIRLAFAISDKGCAPTCQCELCREYSSTADDYLAVLDEKRRTRDGTHQGF